MKRLTIIPALIFWVLASTAWAGVDNTDATVASEVNDQSTELRKQISTEAVQALNLTRDALVALEKEEVDSALEKLTAVTGKLEVLMAREPGLALAPTDVAVTTHDIYASVGAIHKTIDEATTALRKGRVQAARHLLDGLASEIVISVTHIPLGAWPEAIKSVVPLLDSGEIKLAKQQLEEALSTLVVTDQVIALPIVRAESALGIAEALALKADRSEAEQNALDEAMLAVSEQIEMAQLLGYGDKGHYKMVLQQLRKVEKSMAGDDVDPGVIADLKRALSDLFQG